MKNNKILTSIILFIVVSFNACKKENTKLQVKNLKDEKVISVNKTEETQDDKCSSLLKKLVTTSSIQNPFLSTLNVEIDKKENEKLTLKLFDNSDATKAPIGWIILDIMNKKLLDITNDPENPTELKYDSKVWNEIVECYFKSDQLNTNNNSNNCKELHTEEGAKEECIFQDQTIGNIYKRTIENKEVEHANFLLSKLPLNTISKTINQEGIISIDYIIDDGKVTINFLYEGGVTEILSEKKGLDVKRTITHSAD